MNPLLQQAIVAIIRSLLMVGAGWFIHKGIWETGQATEYMGALAAALVTLGWALWSRYKDRLYFLKALELPSGATPQDVKEAVKADKENK